MKSKYIDMVGKEYGKLKVKGVKYKGSRVYCECECECGREIDVYALSLEYGRSKSCGCIQRGMNKLRGKDVESGVREMGVSKYARANGVSRETVYNEMRRRRGNE